MCSNLEVSGSCFDIWDKFGFTQLSSQAVRTKEESSTSLQRRQYLALGSMWGYLLSSTGVLSGTNHGLKCNRGQQVLKCLPAWHVQHVTLSAFHCWISFTFPLPIPAQGSMVSISNGKFILLNWGTYIVKSWKVNPSTGYWEMSPFHSKCGRRCRVLL